MNIDVSVISASLRQTSGLPDRFISGTGIPGCWVEAKFEKGVLRQDQYFKIRRWLNDKANVLIVRGHRDGLVTLEIPLSSKSEFEVLAEVQTDGVVDAEAGNVLRKVIMDSLSQF